ncbi:MAG: efflux RND transporter periplasmic adaptor subunit [Alphaproteobacteria bacterium]
MALTLITIRTTPMKQHSDISLQKLATAARSALVTLLIIGGAGVAAQFGASVLAQRAAAAPQPDPAPLTTVSAIMVKPQDSLLIQRSFQGLVEARQTVNLAFQQGGEIVSLTADEGDRVEAGQVIGKLDTRLLDAERAQLMAVRADLEAQRDLAQLSTERQARLRSRGFAAEQVLDEARLGLKALEARIAGTNASIAHLDVQLTHTRITAPFDGIVAQRMLDQGAVVAAGQNVIEVIETEQLLLRVGLDASILAKTYSQGDLQVSIGGHSYPVIYAGLRPDLDQRTRTRTVLYTIDTDDILYGEAGSLSLAQVYSMRGYRLPMSALRQGVRGMWTVLTLTPEADSTGVYRIGTAAVEILHMEDQFAYVRGTLSGDTLIIRKGTHRAVPGDRVLIDATQHLAATP